MGNCHLVFCLINPFGPKTKQKLRFGERKKAVQKSIFELQLLLSNIHLANVKLTNCQLIHE